MIEGVRPEIDCGRFPIKRIVGERVQVEADIFCDGHDLVACRLLYRHADNSSWTEVPLRPLGNDRWAGEFVVTDLGAYRYTLEGWVDHFQTWRSDLQKRLEARQKVSVELLVGADLIEQAGKRASGSDARQLRNWAEILRTEEDYEHKVRLALADEVDDLVRRYPDRRLATRYGKELTVIVDRQRAGYGAWYELFPRSCADQPGRHGTFADVEARLPYLQEMGFDVLYLPPIHPIGKTHRKGKNNAPRAAADDVGSPWGIGSDDGGHMAIHPQLGTLADFRRLVERAEEHGLEIALDLALQCSPDHPYVREHPEWFRKRPDGSIQYAENPPKKYQDIYPLDFETPHWRELWHEIESIVRFWIDQGVRIFRVDNPHTKPFVFWEWLIRSIKADFPDVIFLSEAFTRPKVMYHLAKLGFSQSYTYFAWRNSKWELTSYFTELTQTDVREYFRPNLWPNTPDILTEYLQHGGRPAFMIRIVLAATLGASYGIYGPPFELCLNQPREPGSEEYLDSEKYQLWSWNLDHPDSLRDFIARLNRIRRQEPALQSDRWLAFHGVSNDQLLCYSKRTEDLKSVVLVVVNLDPQHTQSGWVDLPLHQLGIDGDRPYQVHDLLGGGRYVWHGPHNYVELNPHVLPAHVFRLRRRLRSEKDFEYYA